MKDNDNKNEAELSKLALDIIQDKNIRITELVKEIERLKYTLIGTMHSVERLQQEVNDFEDREDKMYEQAEASLAANIANGGTSCHWCIEHVKSEAIKEFCKKRGIEYVEERF